MGKKKNNTPTKKNPYFGNYDLYSDANPKDTIPIKYDTIENTKKTIKKLERLRKNGKYTHSRIVQVANVMTQRLRVIYNNTGKGKTRYNLSKKYFEKLKKETKKSRKKSKSRRKSKRRKSPKRKSKSRRKSTRGKSYQKRSAVWSRKYKDSIDCKHPKGFSQRAHCTSKKKSKFQNDSTEFCKIKTKLSLNTIRELKLLCKQKDKNGKQNEKAGNMTAIKNSCDIYTIEINQDSMIKGGEVGVDIVPGLYNFHSHPKNAYTIYDVKLGWPSAQDYIGFLMASVEDDTIFHIVATLEGVYIISIHKDWLSNKKFNNTIGDFIAKKYNFSYKDGDTVKSYLNKINKIEYKGSKLFVLQFLPWDKANNMFTITYAKKYDICFTCDKEKKAYEKQSKK